MKRNIYIMYALALLHGMVFYAPIATLYRTAQGVSVFQITLIESISLVLCLVIATAFLSQLQYERCGISTSFM